MMLSVRRSTYRTCGLVVFMVMWLSFGGLIFSILEGGQEDHLRDTLRAFRHRFLVNHTCISGSMFSDLAINLALL